MSLDHEAKPKTANDVEAPVKQAPAGLDAKSARQQSMGEIGAAIQRKAVDKSGAEPSPEVEGTAKAGVAGTGGPLPFHDRIQASFGRHDVSGVRAHVGGEAAQASDALGANAYATGQD